MVAIEARQDGSKKSSVPAPPTPGNFAHKSCWFDGQGHKICGDWSSTTHNLTDIHRQDGVADLHNEHDSNKTESIHGITFKDDPKNPNAEFEGHKQDEDSGLRDAHDDQDEWTDHREDSGHDHQDWKLNATTPSSGTKKEDFWYDGNYHNVSDIQDSKADNTSDVTKVDADQSSFQADYEIDNPGEKKDEDGSVAGQHRGKHELDQHTGTDFFDSHEETNEQTVSSGSFDTYEGLSDAMGDWDKHIDMPAPAPAAAGHPKREANSGEWTVGKINRFDVAVAQGGSSPLLTARHVDGEVPTVGGDEKATSSGNGYIFCFVVLLAIAIGLASGFKTQRDRARRRAKVAEEVLDEYLDAAEEEKVERYGAA